MSLRTKLFMLFGVLMALLVLAQWWLVRSLTERAYQEFGDAVVAVSRQVADLLQNRLAGLETMAGSELNGEGLRVIKLLRGEEDHLEQQGQQVVREDLRTRIRLEKALPPGAAVESPKGQEIDFRYLGDRTASKMSLQIRGDGIDQTIELPSAGLERSLQELSSRLLYGTLAILATGLVFAAVLSGRVSRPLQDLSQAAQGVASGKLGLQVPGRPPQGEVGQAIQAFNRMSLQLQEYDQAQRLWEERRHLSELGEIARGLAHTIRNPLNALGLSLEELAAQSNSSDLERAELVSAARRQIRRIDHWIRSFLTLASQEGHLISPVVLSSLLEDILLELVQDSPARIQLKPNGAELPEILGVEAELRGMVQALAVNAAEAAGAGGNVWIEAQPAEGDRVRIAVEDDGPGLPDEVRQRLFSPHVTTKPWGSGMGIYLAHRIAATRYQGTLEFEDARPGTRAVLTLAARRAEEFHTQARRRGEAEEDLTN